MNALLAAQSSLLLLGAAAACCPCPQPVARGLGLGRRPLAMGLVLSAAAARSWLGGSPLVGELAWAYPVGTLRVRLDALGAFFLAWSLPMTLLGSVYARGLPAPYFGTERHVGVHYALLNMTALSFVLVYTGDHALVFLLGWEIAALAAWLLVIWDYTEPEGALRRLQLPGVDAHRPDVPGGRLHDPVHAPASWDLGSFGRWLQATRGSERNLVFLLLVTSFGLKSAFFPFHSWLPRAHAAAPAHVSALMSGVIHKAGLYALVRFVLLMGRPDEWMGWFLIAFSLLSAVIGALYTVGQRDLKRLLGYSSTENVGIAGIGFGVGCLGLTWGNPRWWRWALPAACCTC
jgi:hydrogenase-4 component B